MRTSVLTLLFTFIIGNLYSQISGNEVYGNANYNNNYNGPSYQSSPKRTIYTTDSTLVLSANIMLNKIADSYLLTVGLNQEAKTAAECNQLMNIRISKLKAD